MKALFKKDFYALKESKILILIMLFVVVIMGFWGKGESTGFILSYVTVLSGVLVLNTISYDEMDNNYAFLLTMPFSRNAYVMEKYLFGIITGTAGWLFSIAVILATSGSFGQNGVFWWSLCAASLCLVYLLQAVMIPIQLKFGGQKGKIVILILFAAVVGAVAAAAKSADLIDRGSRGVSQPGRHLRGRSCFLHSLSAAFLRMQRGDYEAKRVLIQNPPVGRDGHHLPGQKFPACLKGVFYRRFDSAAAGNLHTGDSDAFYFILLYNLSQLFCVVNRIQLRAADEGDFVFHKLIVKVAISVGAAVGGDQKISLIKIRRVNRSQLNLNRPLTQLCLRGRSGR